MALPLDLLQQIHVLLMLGDQELDTRLEVGSHKSRVEGQNHLPRPAGHAAFDAAHDTVGFLDCKGTLPGHIELLVNQHPQVLYLRAALNPFSTQPVFVLGTAMTLVQDLALGLAELHEVHTGPPLKPVQAPVDGIPSLQCVDCTSQLGVIGKLTAGALSPTAHAIDKVVNSTGPNTNQRYNFYKNIFNTQTMYVQLFSLCYRNIESKQLPSSPDAPQVTVYIKTTQEYCTSVTCYRN